VYAAGPELRDLLLGAALKGTGGVQYYLRELLGEGGQGWVYRANYDDPEGAWIVVKVLRPEGVNEEAMQRFEREAEVLRMLGAVPAPNPNIVRFYDYGKHLFTHRGMDLSVPFLALEYVDGQTLAQVISAHGGFGLPIDRVRRIMKQVARALHTVHAHRIVHRDLKPSNILLATIQGQEIAKVTDFGLVKLPELGPNQTATLAGASLGYAPPEQYEMGNSRVSVQTDVFSFVTILFECLSGNEAFPCRPGDNPLRVIARMLAGDRPSLAKMSATVGPELRERPDLVAALDEHIARATNSDPGVRHESLRELWEQIEPILREASRRTASSGVGFDDPMTTEGRDSATPIPPCAAGPTIPIVSQPPVPPSAPVSCEPTRWRLVGQQMHGERLRSVVVSDDLQTVVAVGAHGLYHFSHGVWNALSTPSGLDARFIRGLLRLRDGALLCFGDGGFAVAISPNGAATQVAIPDPDLTLLGAHEDERGLIMVGERRSRAVGVLVETRLRGAECEVRTLEGTVRLQAVTRVGGARILACGTHGELVEITPELHRQIPWGRTGHLRALARARDGGAFVVGSGGHALRVAHPTTLPGVDLPPRATLEIVQTTRDLTNVAVDSAGIAWAVGGQARLLKRRDNLWTRIALDPSVQGILLGLGTTPDAVLIVGEDGLVLEGRS